MRWNRLFTSTMVALSLLGAGAAGANDADIYSIQFSEDGRHLITGGASGQLAGPDDEFSGGIKVWDVETGELVKALGHNEDLESVFGNEYGRIGKRRWAIHSFKDVVMHGTYPKGKVLLLPNSLGHMAENDRVEAPSFVGATLDFDSGSVSRVNLDEQIQTQGNCAENPYLYDYIGPVVPSDNGRFAAIVVNLCTAKKGAAASDQAPQFEYVSNLHIMDLASQKVVRSLPAIDGGVYALGVTDDADRVAFVGRDRFAVVETASGERTDIEQYDDGVFMIPRQFSKLHFSKDGNKLISLRYIYDIETGTETELSWTETDAKKPKRVSQVRIAPDLSYFVLVQKQRALFMIGEDGLPRSYGKADRVIVWDTETGAERELPITDSMTEGKRCVVDISPNSQQVAVACKGGIIRLFSARDGELLWSKVNQGYKNEPLGKHLIQASADPLEPLRFTLGLDQDADWLLSELDARALRFN